MPLKAATFDKLDSTHRSHRARALRQADIVFLVQELECNYFILNTSKEKNFLRHPNIPLRLDANVKL
jgi:hypothetical protein